jgi:hypothetical protein
VRVVGSRELGDHLADVLDEVSGGAVYEVIDRRRQKVRGYLVPSLPLPAPAGSAA